MSTAQDKTAALIAALWQKNRPVIEERIALLASSDPTTQDGHTAMLEAAHKLAGALGMYGYPEASATASRIEDALRRNHLAHLPELITALRNALPS
ncbi:Hpt domain-containing protein [Terriglobus tenax]|uniref:Hpt domain-containing protein n=1 Tax=Terriglobus tenax TaxID=1111115 RepID=UPI0021E00F83|nr:Hpt domain-containing protein [Terriglobus tenax]